MKLAELFDNHLKESLNAPLPFTKETDNRYRIELSDKESIVVILYEKEIQKYKCVSVIFLNPHAEKGKENSLTGFFNGPKAIRVLSTIIAILDKTDFELLVLIPDDINVNVERRKTRLYNTVLIKMQRLGRIVGHEEVNFPEFSKPVLVGLHGDGSLLSSDEISTI